MTGTAVYICDSMGLVSDFDGISVAPEPIEDVSDYPHITQGLLERGYSEAEIKKILGENLLRVMRGVEEASREIQKDEEVLP